MIEEESWDLLMGGAMGFMKPAPNLILGAANICALPPLSCC